ncbi:NurA domain protein [Methanocaldococcus vulcanius M7]|uniref:NurA domain protein n=1 Tax=Methanocaldococcus vulcanius (strain ATCC 700851 / DSM 12094 / M7) TaxID=579137 RepID=C9RGH2_METVM|nr:DNA double-strand break repair nuclease NurA [Methanocaldococcus vulcanius]ACX72674.1 NurA domain protein [Methanocaldococcus vulcanius M7]
MIEYLLKNRDQIIKKMEKINDIDKKEVEEHWILNDFDDPVDLNFAGGDGSCNKIDYISFSFYGVGAVSFMHRNGEKIRQVGEEYIFDIAHPLEIEDRIRRFMQILELKTAMYVLKNYNVDYYLFDGSLFSLLISTKKGMEAYEEQLKNVFLEYKKEFSKKIDEEIETGEIGVISKDLEYNLNEKILIEHVEYIITLTKLINEFKDKLIGISKTSKINIYFDRNMPDIAIFTKYTDKAGYSKPIDFLGKIGDEKKEKHKQLSSIVKGIHFIEKHPFNAKIGTAYIQFIRLEDNCGVVGLTSFNKVDEGVISSIKEISINGYPYILKKAHNTVELTTKKLETIAKMLNIDDPIARHILGKRKK